MASMKMEINETMYKPASDFFLDRKRIRGNMKSHIPNLNARKGTVKLEKGLASAKPSVRPTAVKAVSNTLSNRTTTTIL